jgi:hypothetical protein
VRYRLARPEILELSKALRIVAERRLAELERLVREHFGYAVQHVGFCSKKEYEADIEAILAEERTSILQTERCSI